MYKIGIISDTHGLLRVEVAQELAGCDAILHGGDINSRKILDEINGMAPTYAVRGNNDKEWAADLPKTLAVTLGGVRFFIVHNKKDIPKDMGDVDVVVYGHSHKYEEKYAGSCLMLNPGSCGPRRFNQPITLALLTAADDGSYEVRKIEIAHRPKGTDTDKTACRDMKRIVRAVMRDTDKGVPVKEIAAKNGIDGNLAEQICRLYLTHPGVSADGILGKMGL